MLCLIYICSFKQKEYIELNILYNKILYYYTAAYINNQVFVISFLMLQFLKHSLFFLHCCSNSLRSNNLTENRSKKTAHKKLSRKENEITWEYFLKYGRNYNQYINKAKMISILFLYIKKTAVFLYGGYFFYFTCINV